MPDLLPVPGVLKLHMGMTVGEDTTTGWHQFYRYGTTPGTANNLQTLASQTSVFWTQRFQTLTTAGVKLTSVVYTDLAAQTAPIGTWIGSIAGTKAAGDLPANACVLWNYKVARRYRGGKPRSYVPVGSTADLLDPQKFTSTAITAFNTAMTNFVGDITSLMGTWTSTHNLCNVSYYHGGNWIGPDGGPYKFKPTPRNPPLVDDVVSYSANQILGSQRRRIRS